MGIDREIRREQKIAKMQADLAGEGMYVFENNLKGDLYLPRPTQSGRRFVRKGEQFLGDSYYFSMLRTNELKLVREVAPQASQQKLLTEQPPVVTNEGTVEFVQDQPKTQYNEGKGGPQPDVLLTESPVGGIKVIR